MAVQRSIIVQELLFLSLLTLQYSTAPIRMSYGDRDREIYYNQTSQDGWRLCLGLFCWYLGLAVIYTKSCGPVQRWFVCQGSWHTGQLTQGRKVGQQKAEQNTEISECNSCFFFFSFKLATQSSLHH